MIATTDERRQRIVVEIAGWVARKKAGEPVPEASRGEIGALKGIDRALALRTSLISSFSLYYADNPKADCALGVLVITTLLSDNDDGCCSASVGTMGKLLSREPRTITEARNRLYQLKLMGVEERAGRPSLAWPLISMVLINDPRASLTWLMDAIIGERKGQGRPKKPLRRMDGGISNTPVVDDKYPRLSTTPYLTDNPPLREAAVSEVERRFKLPHGWSLPMEWRDWTNGNFNATAEALGRSARKFHFCKAEDTHSASGWLKAWQLWCHSEHSFAIRSTGGNAPATSGLPDEAWRVHVQGFRKSGYWHPHLGPNPDQPGCRAPAQILASCEVGDAA
jgi:hypothetical protein